MRYFTQEDYKALKNIVNLIKSASSDKGRKPITEADKALDNLFKEFSVDIPECATNPNPSKRERPKRYFIVYLLVRKHGDGDAVSMTPSNLVVETDGEYITKSRLSLEIVSHDERQKERYNRYYITNINEVTREEAVEWKREFYLFNDELRESALVDSNGFIDMSFKVHVDKYFDKPLETKQ